MATAIAAAPMTRIIMPPRSVPQPPASVDQTLVLEVGLCVGFGKLQATSFAPKSATRTGCPEGPVVNPLSASEVLHAADPHLVERWCHGVLRSRGNPFTRPGAARELRWPRPALGKSRGPLAGSGRGPSTASRRWALRSSWSSTRRSDGESERSFRVMRAALRCTPLHDAPSRSLSTSRRGSDRPGSWRLTGATAAALLESRNLAFALSSPPSEMWHATCIPCLARRAQ
jgi:hypothetical protein